ncbi:cysteine desulfurase family protein [Anaeromicropila populeti]|uniref:cysteine desulfurase n=1 Tax=Anaeromicropila populeti TaxID=37658 RepID=A0A1I6IPI0_9FIRM|nr:cysteine desulfurase family protein [Anaeromicropila populeti]SFR68657.1 cysteine desulfurase [Anaeromicropila populeti]
MEVYLDNAATTKPFEAVRKRMWETLEENYGNPSSMHKKGVEAEKYVREARETIAAALKAEQKEIIFTSGGTESNNMALIGAAYANQRAGKHIITTKIEHPSVHNPLFFLEEQGFQVTYLNVDKNGRVILEELAESIRKETILVSVMYVNNEVGACEKIDEISKIIKEKNENTVFHVDAIQGFGKYKIYPKRLGIDLLSVSAHKIHGPKGAGFLYVQNKVKIKPILFGGEQQRGLRSGTENVPGIAGLSKAVEEIYKNYDEKRTHLYKLKKYFIDRIGEMGGVMVNGIENIPIEETAPHIVSVSFEDVRSEVLLHALEEKGIYVSSGSACASNHPQLSGTLKAMGIPKKYLDSTLRFSFSVSTTIEEIDYTIEELKKIVPVLKRFTRH